MRLDIDLPPGMGADARAELLGRETARARELMDAGVIARIWRLPGRYANVGVWEVPDATALHEAISSLPLFPYMDAEVVALARHYLEEECPASGPAGS